jgi:hypothetical protein
MWTSAPFSRSSFNESGDTPLHFTYRQGHMDVVRLLLKNGADINATNEYGKAPLHLACSEGHTGSGVLPLLVVVLTFAPFLRSSLTISI